MANKALLIGVDAYRHHARLHGCRNDARALSDVLMARHAFKPRNVRVLTDDDATARRIQKQVDWLLESPADSGQRVLFIACRGTTLAANDEPALCPADFDFGDPRTFLPLAWLEQRIAELGGMRETLVILDTCHSASHAFDPSSRYPVHSRFLASGGRDRSASANAPGRAQPSGSAGNGGTPAPSVAGLSWLTAAQPGSAAGEALFEGQTRGILSYHLERLWRSARRLELSEPRIAFLSAEIEAEGFSQRPHLSRSPGLACGSAPPAASPAAPHAGPGSNGTGSKATPDAAFPVSDAEAVAAVVHWVSGPENTLPLGLRSHVLRLMENVVRSTDRPPGAPEHPTRRQILCLHDLPADSPATTALISEGIFGPHTWLSAWHWSTLFPTPERSTKPRYEEAWLAGQFAGTIDERATRQLVRSRGYAPSSARNGSSSGEGRPSPDLERAAAYLSRPDLRAAVIAELRMRVLEIAATGARVDLIAHGWGSLIGLDLIDNQMGDNHADLPIDRLVTLGAALSLPGVARWFEAGRLAGPPNPARPRWTNLNVEGDHLGGPLGVLGYAIDDERLGLPGVPEPPADDASSPHAAYFEGGNLRRLCALFETPGRAAP